MLIGLFQTWIEARSRGLDAEAPSSLSALEGTSWTHLLRVVKNLLSIIHLGLSWSTALESMYKSPMRTLTLLSFPHSELISTLSLCSTMSEKCSAY